MISPRHQMSPLLARMAHCEAMGLIGVGPPPPLLILTFFSNHWPLQTANIKRTVRLHAKRGWSSDCPEGESYYHLILEEEQLIWKNTMINIMSDLEIGRFINENIILHSTMLIAIFVSYRSWAESPTNLNQGVELLQTRKAQIRGVVLA